MSQLGNSKKYRVLRNIRGTSLIEVLMAIVILTFGLLGLAAMQGKAHTAEFESYQRGQALILMQDIVSRINGNPANIASYVTTSTPLGTGATDATNCATETTTAAKDKCEWSKALKGASEKKAVGGGNVGGMVDARGCIEATANLREYQISIVWQGMSEGANQSWVACGSASYTPALSRRAYTSIVQIPDLAAP